MKIQQKLYLVLVLLMAAFPAINQAQTISGQIKGDPPQNPVRTGPVLYDQLSNPTGGYYASDEFTDAENLTRSCQSADDFIVPAGDTWNIGTIRVSGYYWPDAAGGATAINVYIYADDNGQPGTALFTFENVTDFNVTETPINGNQIYTLFDVPFSPTINLSAGHYWLSFQVVSDYGVNGQWGWESAMNDPWLNDQVQWRNPGDGFGYGYTTWTPGTTVFMFGYMDQSFALYEAPLDNDLSAKEMLGPQNSTTLGNSEIIQMRLKNEGGLPQTAFNVSYSINNGTPVIENTGSLTVNPEESYDYSFTTSADLSQPGIYNITLATNLSGDQVTSNDTTYGQVVNYGTVYTMQDGVNITTCSGTFVDPGGIDGDFGMNDMATMTIYPGTPGDKVRLSFISFDVTWSDFMIYDGENTDAPLMGSWNDGTDPPGVITALNLSGALTISFAAPGWDSAPGWKAVISCYQTPENDFAILDFSRSSYAVFTGDNITYTANLRNLGALAQSKDVTFTLDGTVVGTVNTGNVNPTEYATVDFTTSIASTGNHTMIASIPADGGDDPSNNSANMNFGVYTFGSLVEFFEGDNFPPDFWRTNYWYQQTDPSFAFSGTGAAESYVNTFAYDTLFTPQLTISAGDSISFRMKNSLWWPGNLILGWVDGNTGVFNTLDTIIPTIYYENYKVDISAAAGNNYIAFINYEDDWAYWGGQLDIDDVVGIGPVMYFVDDDLSAYNLDGTVTPTVNVPETYTVTVRNIGALDLNAGSYQVKLMQSNPDGDDIVLQALSGQAIQHLQQINYTFNYTFEASGEYDVYAEVVFAPDMIMSNNATVMKHLYVQVAGTVEDPAGNGDLWDYYMPLFSSAPYSLDEMIYPDTMVTQTGPITGITYFYENTSYSDVNGVPVNIWIGTTTQTDMSNGWIPSTQLTQVVISDTLNFQMGRHEVYIPFDVPFNYNGGNIAVMVMKDSTDYLSLVTFRNSDMPYQAGLWSTQYNPRPDPANPDSTVYGNPANYLTDAVFFVNTLGLGELGGTVYDENGQAFEGVQIKVNGYSLNATTDNNGAYFFNEVLGGQQSVSADIFEYEENTQPITIVSGFYNNLDFNMVRKPLITLSGTVVGSDDPAHFLGDAQVEITGYFPNFTSTNQDGEFAMPGVYGNETYVLTVSKPGFETYVDNNVVVNGTDLNIGTVVLNELQTIPFYVHGTEAADHVNVSWNAPNSGIDSKLDYYVNINNGYANDVNEEVWMGNLYHPISRGTITSVDLHFAAYPAPGSNELVSLDILDKTGRTLVTSDPFITPLDAWINVDVPNIAYDDDFYVMVHWQNNPNTTHFLGIEEETAKDWAYIKYPGADPSLLSEVTGNTGIFDIVVNTTDQLNPPQASDPGRWIESYNIYKGLYSEISQASTWTPLNTEPLTDTSFIDNSWPPDPLDRYVYAVEAIFTTGESEMSFSNPIFNVAPEFVSEPVTTGTVSVEYTYDVIATDANADNIAITSDTIPAWLTLVDHGDGTATLSGTPTQMGSYDVVLVASDGTLETTQAFTIFTDPVGIDEISGVNLRMYPNPVKNQLYIDWNGVSEASLYNAYGKLVGTYKNLSGHSVLDMSSFAKGVYLIRFKENGTILSRKFIKN